MTYKVIDFFRSRILSREGCQKLLEAKLSEEEVEKLIAEDDCDGDAKFNFE